MVRRFAPRKTAVRGKILARAERLRLEASAQLVLNALPCAKASVAVGPLIGREGPYEEFWACLGRIDRY